MLLPTVYFSYYSFSQKYVSSSTRNKTSSYHSKTKTKTILDPLPTKDENEEKASKQTKNNLKKLSQKPCSVTFWVTSRELFLFVQSFNIFICKVKEINNLLWEFVVGIIGDGLCRAFITICGTFLLWRQLHARCILQQGVVSVNNGRVW